MKNSWEQNSHAVTLDGDWHPGFVLFTSGGPGTLGTGQREAGVYRRGSETREREKTLDQVKASRSKLHFEASDSILSGFKRDEIVPEAG